MVRLATHRPGDPGWNGSASGRCWRRSRASERRWCVPLCRMFFTSRRNDSRPGCRTSSRKARRLSKTSGSSSSGSRRPSTRSRPSASTLGCTVKLVSLNQPKTVTVDGRPMEEHREFHCPCHGSKYYGNGINYAGPAPRPLTWYRLAVSPDDGQLIVDLSEPVHRDFRLSV